MGSTFEDSLLSAVESWGVSITPRQLELLRAHFQAVVSANRTMNLTRIVDPAAAAVKHYADSLALCAWAQERGIEVETLLDIGTGAGYPAVPIAILRPEWTVTAIDATRKKTRFLTKATKAIGLGNLRICHAHTDHWRSERSFQIVTLRAVAPWPRCLKLADRYIPPGGRAVFYQTAAAAGDGTGPNRESLLSDLHAEPPFLYRLRYGGETLDRSLYVCRRPKTGPFDSPAP